MSVDTSTVPFFSVVIPTFQRNDLLANCLRCLSSGQQRDMHLVGAESEPSIGGSAACAGAQDSVSCSVSASYEVVVADDGRQTTAYAMLERDFPWVRWVRGPGTGPAANRNAGARVARGSWLAFTDDDCLPQAGWLAAYHAAILANGECKVFEGKTSPDRPRKTLREHAPINEHGGLLWSCNFTIQRSLFAVLGGFDCQFRVCMEDNDFAVRIRNAGLKFPFTSEALVLHPWRLRSAAIDGWKRLADEKTDIRAFLGKHPSHRSVLTPIRFLKMAFRGCLDDIRFVMANREWSTLPLVGARLFNGCRIAASVATF